MASKVVSSPSVSVIVATYNSGKTLESCLSAVRNQDYPQKQIEIVLGDGGSTDATLEIAKKYDCQVIKVPPNLQHAEYNRGMAFNHATGDYALILDHDNFLPNKHWLTDMLEPLLENRNVVASETCFYDYNKNYGLFDRYFALYGASEPLPYYLHKADRMPQTANSWILQGHAEDKGKYYLVEFEADPRKIPSLGTNGCLMRRKLVLDNAQADPAHHYPIDVMVDVIKNGHNKFAFVKTSIIHLTHSRGLMNFFKRKLKFVEQYHFQETAKRRWSVVMPGDEINVLKFIIYSLTFVKPLYDSFQGYRKIPDVAWFLHPILCFTTTVIYGFVVIKYKILAWQ